MSQEAAELAGWEDEQIEFIREKVTEEGKLEDLKKGKAPEQVAKDQTVYLFRDNGQSCDVHSTICAASAFFDISCSNCRWFLTRRHF